jgi:GH15 family glucan-1,4-alpha-glucosidase
MMPALRIEDYALIGDCQTAALVNKNGSIDWLCFPKFDSPACFAALLGTRDNGRWCVAPSHEIKRVRRRYRSGTLILETDFETEEGEVRLIDCMPPRTADPDLVRTVECLRGRVPMHMELVIRFDYGSITPWVRHIPGGIRAVAGPDTLYCRSNVEVHGEDMRTVADFTLSAGQRASFDLTWRPTYSAQPESKDPEQTLQDTEKWWREWSSQCSYDGEWKEAVLRSLITLKALTYAPTGGIIAAPTTSLPESLGGVRNWDYRYCWLRDATFTLYALMVGGYTREANAWRQWLVNSVAGTPENLNLMYGLAGERRLTELTLDWLPGYEGSKPVRSGNAAYAQHQVDVYGEVMDALQVARRAGLKSDENAWRVQQAMMQFLENDWRKPDEGIWEVRGAKRQFTHSKVMAWLAADRAVTAVEEFGLTGDAAKWRRLRSEIHADVCRQGFNRELNSFVQFYGSAEPDASLLMLPLVGFLPHSDPRIIGTLDFIQRHLLRDGFVQRYRIESKIDGLPPGEGTFLLCTYWLADNLSIQGRHREAREIFERLLSIRNDVGLLPEQFDPQRHRFLGNFPQAFSHVGLINTARNLSQSGGPAEDRKRHQDEAS